MDIDTAYATFLAAAFAARLQVADRSVSSAEIVAASADTDAKRMLEKFIDFKKHHEEGYYNKLVSMS